MFTEIDSSQIFVNDLKFHDTVAWDKGRYPRRIDRTIAKYGPGPFQVVGIRLHRQANAVNPLAVTIEPIDYKLPGKKLPEFTAEWLRRVYY